MQPPHKGAKRHHEHTISVAKVLKSTIVFSYNSMSQQPNLATEEIRLAIIEALRDPKSRFFSRSDHASRNYLDLWGLTEDNVYQAMIASLEMHELQEKPKQDARDKLKYQHLLYYPCLLYTSPSPRDRG